MSLGYIFKSPEGKIWDIVNNSDNDEQRIFFISKFLGKVDLNKPGPKGYPLINNDKVSPKVAQFLIDNGADVNLISGEPIYDSMYISKISSYYNSSPLMRECVKRNIEKMKIFIDNGADINYKDIYGSSCLHKFFYLSTNYKIPESPYRYEYILNNEKIKIVKNGIDLLLNSGINVDVEDKYGDTPLISAIRAFDYYGFIHLIEKGANSRKKNKRGDTPWYFARSMKDDNDSGAWRKRYDMPGDTAFWLDHYNRPFTVEIEKIYKYMDDQHKQDIIDLQKASEAKRIAKEAQNEPQAPMARKSRRNKKRRNRRTQRC